MDRRAVRDFGRAVAALTLAVVVSGCAVERITPSAELLDVFSKMQGDELKHLSVALDMFETDQNGKALIREIRSADVFGSVVLLDQTNEPADLILSPYTTDEPIHGKGTCFENMLTPLTLGIIPGVCEKPGKLTISIRGPNERTLTITEDYTSKTIEGWFGLPIAFTEEWTYLGSKHAFLRELFLGRSKEINRLAESSQ